MKEIFDQEYYGVDEGDQKPEFPFDPEIDDGMLKMLLKFYSMLYTK